jgi:hypothetical protein
VRLVKNSVRCRFWVRLACAKACGFGLRLRAKRKTGQLKLATRVRDAEPGAGAKTPEIGRQKRNIRNSVFSTALGPQMHSGLALMPWRRLQQLPDELISLLVF